MPTLTSLKQLQYLVSLADHLNFTRAAQACFVTQSTLSAGLKELEDTLGICLVERDRQTVFLTPVGRETVKRARDILAATQDMVQMTQQSTQPMNGLLRLGVIPTIAPFLLAPCLQLLRQSYPALQLVLREDLTAHLLERVEKGQLDLALIALPTDTRRLHVHPLFNDALWVVGLSDDPVFADETIAMTPELADRLLLLEDGHCLREHTLYACAASRPQGDAGVQATSLLTLVQMVMFGLGIGLVPAMAAHSALTQSPLLRVRPLAQPSPVRTVALVSRRSTARQLDIELLGQAIVQVSHSLGGAALVA